MLSHRTQPPVSRLGTDEFGRDILARLVHGSRVSLSVGVVAVSIALLIGGSLGAIAGFYGGKIDNVIMRIMDIFLAVPSLLLSITIVSALGPSIFNLMLAIAISSVPGYARIVRASVLTVKDQEFVEAAKCIGANNFEIISSHILPNCMAPIIVQGLLEHLVLRIGSQNKLLHRHFSFLAAHLLCFGPSIKFIPAALN